MINRRGPSVNRSNETELAGADEALSASLWARRYLQHQGCGAAHILRQGSQPAIQLERNGRESAGKRPRRLGIKRFRIRGRARGNELAIKLWPTGVRRVKE